MTDKISIVLADDHPLIRAGIRNTLQSEADLVVVGEASDSYGAQRLCRLLQPQVLVLDLHMPGPPPTETVAALQLQCPAVRVLVLTAYDDDAYIRGMVAAQVAGYVLKDDALEMLGAAIRTIAQGRVWFSQSVLLHLAGGSTFSVPPPPPLTEQEQRILERLAEGWENGRIASELGLAEQTVRNYVSRIYLKIGASSRTGAAIWAREHGLTVGNGRSTAVRAGNL